MRHLLGLAVALACIGAPPARSQATWPPAVMAPAATLGAPGSGMAGSAVTILYAPAQAPQGSFITIIGPEAAATDYTPGSWAHVDGGEATLYLPTTAGYYELRYVLAAPGGPEVIQRQPIAATPPFATLEAPPSAAAGSAVTVAFTGPRGHGDYIAVAAVHASDDEYIAFLTIDGDAAAGEITMPGDSGTYELRYVMGAADLENAVLARQRITVH